MVDRRAVDLFQLRYALALCLELEETDGEVVRQVAKCPKVLLAHFQDNIGHFLTLLCRQIELQVMEGLSVLLDVALRVFYDVAQYLQMSLVDKVDVLPYLVPS